MTGGHRPTGEGPIGPPPRQGTVARRDPIAVAVVSTGDDSRIGVTEAGHAVLDFLDASRAGWAQLDRTALAAELAIAAPPMSTQVISNDGERVAGPMGPPSRASLVRSAALAIFMLEGEG